MKTDPPQTRRGVALLVALIAVVTVSTLAVGALQRSVNGSTEAELLLRSKQARLLVEDFTPQLLEWAAEDGSDVINASDDPAGWVPIFESDSGALKVRIHAIDCCGRLHIDRIDTFARLGLPHEIQRLSSSNGLKPKFRDAPDLQPLLETLASSLSGQERISTFPDPARSGDLAETIYLADWITTQGDGALNVNTAPIPLLRAALRGLDPEAARSILGLRESGEPIPAALIRSTDRDQKDSAKRVPLTTTSSAIGFIVTTTELSSRHRWWIVAERLSRAKSQGSTGQTYGADPSAIGAWRITERRKIER